VSNLPELPERARFEALATKLGLPKQRDAANGYVVEVTNLVWLSWQEAVKQERERCALICEEIETKYWAAFKGKTVPIDREALYNSHTEGVSDGAGQCGSAIRSRALQQGD